MEQKYIHQLKQGDIVHFHGARFEILEDARPVGTEIGARYVLDSIGPSDTAAAPAVCIDGSETPGYIEHGRPWAFQGNFRAGRYSVE